MTIMYIASPIRCEPDYRRIADRACYEGGDARLLDYIKQYTDTYGVAMLALSLYLFN